MSIESIYTETLLKQLGMLDLHMCTFEISTLTDLVSQSDTVLSAEQVQRVLEYGKKFTAFTEFTCPLRVEWHTPLRV